jgi:hypothetical protein
MCGLSQSTSGWGVYGSGGIGVGGSAWGGGVGVMGYAQQPSVIPFVASAASGQTANLQEWQNCSGSALGVMDASGYLTVGHPTYSNTTDGGVKIQGTGISNGASDLGLRIRNTTAQGNEWYIDSTGSDGTSTSQYGAGKLAFVCGLGSSPTVTLTPDKYVGIGTTAPARSVHLQGSNACFRMDRNANSAAFILVRTSNTDFNTVWKTFYVGVDASDVDNGSFFIGDRHNQTTGGSEKRLIIENTGNVVPPTTKTGSIGTSSLKWGDIWCSSLHHDDLMYENGVRTSEDGDCIAFYNQQGTKIARLDAEGNWHIKGKIMEDL